MIVVKDISTGESWTYSTDRGGYAQALARYKDILCQGHQVYSTKPLSELEYGAY
ncbi:hypothetical protein IJ847_00720 [Candidatus Saccharibacteria bacterium]|nr:hypothetical protein [Candidatus Saccharibacteria bacterium]